MQASSVGLAAMLTCVVLCSMAGSIWLWLIHGGSDDHPAGHDTELE